MASVHVSGISREKFLALVIARVEHEDFELVDEPSESTSARRRLVVNRSGRWLAVSEEDMDVVGWAVYLSESLEAPVLGLATSPGMEAAFLVRYSRGRRVARLVLPQELLVDTTGRISVSLELIEPWMSRAPDDVGTPTLILDEGSPHTATTLEVLEAVCHAIHLPRPFLSPHRLDSEAGDLEIDFRSTLERARPA